MDFQPTRIIYSGLGTELSLRNTMLPFLTKRPGKNVYALVLTLAGLVAAREGVLVAKASLSQPTVPQTRAQPQQLNKALTP